MLAQRNKQYRVSGTATPLAKNTLLVGPTPEDSFSKLCS
jgi:hypothetical protein